MAQKPFKINSTNVLAFPEDFGAAGQVLTDDGSGGLYWSDKGGGGGGGSSLWTEDGSDIYYDAGNVGIGGDAASGECKLKVRSTAAEVRIGSDDENVCTLKFQQDDATSTSLKVGTSGVFELRQQLNKAYIIF